MARQQPSKANTAPSSALRRRPLEETVQTADRSRRSEILDAAAAVIASSGLRAPLQEIADAAGIFAGSLYHHFESRDAILVALMRRYHSDLERIAATAQDRLDASDSRPASENILDLARDVNRCALHHSAALHMSFYEAPSENPELIVLCRRRVTVVQEAMLQTLDAGQRGGEIRADINLGVLADHFCQAMLFAGLETTRSKATPDRAATELCRIMLDGLASSPPDDTQLDRSRAFAAADELIQSWAADRDAEPQDRAAHIRAAARTEFARRGYELTTVRDIGAAAGIHAGNMYRVTSSKEELLAAIMRSFAKRVGEGWASVLNADATVIEKLDALSWIKVNALDQFPDEFKIELAWMRQTPPTVANPVWSYKTRLRQMKTLLSEGIRSGEIRADHRSTELLARFVLGIQWIPENILRSVGKRDSLLQLRETVLRGVSNRGG